MITRRGLLKGLAGFAAAMGSVGGYAFGIEPLWRLRVARYRVALPRWPAHSPLKVAMLADLHAGEPQMPVSRIAEIVDTTNALDADLIVLLGDYTASHRWQTRRVAPGEWAGELARLKARLGVHAVLGNHDWWEDAAAQRAQRGPTLARRALEHVGIPVHENDAVRLEAGSGTGFWLAGLGDQLAIVNRMRQGAPFRGVDNLPAVLAKVSDDAPVILLAHEPDIFPQVPQRVALTLSGHTHGGQVRLVGWSPYVPSRYGNRYAYGHVVEANRHLIVSGGLGCSLIPVRFGMPPEIVLVEVEADRAASA